MLSILLREVPGRKNNGPRIRKPSSCPVTAVPMAPLSVCSGLSQGNATLDHTTIQGRCGHHELRHLGREVSRKMVLFTKADRGFYCRIRSGLGQATRGTVKNTHDSLKRINRFRLRCCVEKLICQISVMHKTKVGTTKFEHDLRLAHL